MLLGRDGQFSMVNTHPEEWTVHLGHGFMLNPSKRQIRFATKAVKIPRIKFSILESIAKSPQSILPISEIFPFLYGKSPDVTNIYPHIFNLNNLLEKISGTRPLAVKSRGGRWIVHVKNSQTDFSYRGILRYQKSTMTISIDPQSTNNYTNILFNRLTIPIFEKLFLENFDVVSIIELHSEHLLNPMGSPLTDFKLFRNRTIREIYLLNKYFQNITNSGQLLILRDGNDFYFNPNVISPQTELMDQYG